MIWVCVDDIYKASIRQLEIRGRDVQIRDRGREELSIGQTIKKDFDSNDLSIDMIHDRQDIIMSFGSCSQLYLGGKELKLWQLFYKL